MNNQASKQTNKQTMRDHESERKETKKREIEMIEIDSWIYRAGTCCVIPSVMTLTGSTNIITWNSFVAQEIVWKICQESSWRPGLAWPSLVWSGLTFGDNRSGQDLREPRVQLLSWELVFLTLDSLHVYKHKLKNRTEANWTTCASLWAFQSFVCSICCYK